MAITRVAIPTAATVIASKTSIRTVQGICAQPRSAAADTTTVAIAMMSATMHANTISQPNVCGADVGSPVLRLTAWSVATSEGTDWNRPSWWRFCWLSGTREPGRNERGHWQRGHRAAARMRPQRSHPGQQRQRSFHDLNPCSKGRVAAPTLSLPPRPVARPRTELFSGNPGRDDPVPGMQIYRAISNQIAPVTRGAGVAFGATRKARHHGRAATLHVPGAPDPGKTAVFRTIHVKSGPRGTWADTSGADVASELAGYTGWVRPAGCARPGPSDRLAGRARVAGRAR